MKNMISFKFLMLASLLLVISGCDSIFDTGHTERKYDGSPQIEFFPLSRTVTQAAGSTSLAIQLIGPQRDSDLSISFSIDESSTAEEDVHYSILSSSPVTLAAGTSAVNVEINLIDGNVSDPVTLILILDGADADDVIVAQNYKQSVVTIQQ